MEGGKLMIEKFSEGNLPELAAYACRKNARRESGSAFCCREEASIRGIFWRLWSLAPFGGRRGVYVEF